MDSGMFNRMGDAIVSALVICVGIGIVIGIGGYRLIGYLAHHIVIGWK